MNKANEIKLPPPDLWRNGNNIQGYAMDPGNGPWYTAETVRALLAAAPQAPAAPTDMSVSFVEWFVKNYPGDTIIVDPAWHARSIFRMAQAHARLAAGAAPTAPAVDASELEWLTKDGRAHGFRVLQAIEGAVITHSTESLRASIAAAQAAAKESK